MYNTKIETLRKDLVDIIEKTLCHYYGTSVDDIEDDLKNEIERLLWQYEMTDFLGK